MICPTDRIYRTAGETLILPVIPIFNIQRKNFCYLLKWERSLRKSSHNSFIKEVIELRRVVSLSKVTSVDADETELGSFQQHEKQAVTTEIPAMDLALGAEAKIRETTEYIQEQISDARGNTITKDRNEENDDLRNEMEETMESEEKVTKAPVESEDLENTPVHGKHFEDNDTEKVFQIHKRTIKESSNKLAENSFKKAYEQTLAKIIDGEEVTIPNG